MDIDLSASKPLSEFFPGKKIIVSDRMQKGYEYYLEEEVGKNFDPEFTPELTPQEMLIHGVFEGKYLNDCASEFPREWYEASLKEDKLSKIPEISKNFFGIKSRQPLSVWKEKGWILPDDPDVRGWFQWYCRYYLGRRIPEIDQRQIKRWKAFRRHAGQIKKNCEPHDLSCRPRQRQALLQWAYNPFI